jgi:hypothetical protein
MLVDVFVDELHRRQRVATCLLHSWPPTMNPTCMLRSVTLTHLTDPSLEQRPDVDTKVAAAAKKLADAQPEPNSDGENDGEDLDDLLDDLDKDDDFDFGSLREQRMKELKQEYGTLFTCATPLIRQGVQDEGHAGRLAWQIYRSHR